MGWIPVAAGHRPKQKGRADNITMNPKREIDLLPWITPALRLESVQRFEGDGR